MSGDVEAASDYHMSKGFEEDLYNESYVQAPATALPSTALVEGVNDL